MILRCVFPADRLDDLLGLEERLNRKIARAAASIGVGEVLPDQIAWTEINSADDPAAQARNILGAIEHLGLEPCIPPEPLPEIAPGYVHPVAWTAVL